MKGPSERQINAYIDRWIERWTERCTRRHIERERERQAVRNTDSTTGQPQSTVRQFPTAACQTGESRQQTLTAVWITDPD